MAAWLLVVVLSMLSVYGAAGRSASYDDDHAHYLIGCMDAVYQLRYSPSPHQLQATLEYCEDAVGGYSTHKGIPIPQEIKSILRAAYQYLEHNSITAVKEHIYEFLERVMKNYLDEETHNTIHRYIDQTGHAYKLYKILQGSRIQDRLIMRTATIGLFYNPVTTKATKKLANWAKYGNYVGIAADAAEFGLGMMGYKSEGKVVGAVGNTASGAMTGFSVAGPPGAAIGAGVGLLMWWW